MYVKKNKTRNGRIYLSIVDTYYDKAYGHSRSKTVKSLGYLDDLLKRYEDPIAHFSEVAKQLKIEKTDRIAPVMLQFKCDETIPAGIARTKNFGYAVLSKIYHELGIHTFLSRKQTDDDDFNANAIVKLLVYANLLCPSSQKNIYDNRTWFFEKDNYSFEDIYRCFAFLAKHADELQAWINQQSKTLYLRNPALLYYDIASYYLESDTLDTLRRKSIYKEYTPHFISQMSLFMDSNGIPIAYELLPRNMKQFLNYRPAFEKIKTRYNLERIIAIAHQNIVNEDILWRILAKKDGYILRASVRNADQELKQYVQNEQGYNSIGKDYKQKSRIFPRTLNLTTTQGKKVKKTIDEKQIIIYSQRYAERTKQERNAIIEKARDLIKNPARYSMYTSHITAGYVKNIQFDKWTGEILTPKEHLKLNHDKIRKEEELDGYYILLTSEYHEKDNKIIDIYRSSWRIEESFFTVKNEMETSPAYISQQEYLEAHSLIGFISFTIARILETKTEHKYSIRQLLESLKRAECTYIKENYYLFTYCDELLADIGSKVELDFTKRLRTQGEIRKALASTKK